MNPTLALDEAYFRAKYPFSRLVLPVGGLLSGVTRLMGESTAPDFEIAVANLDNLTKVFPYVSRADGTDAFNEPLGGAGADVKPELAWIRAVMEGAERYATMAHSGDDFATASANELGALALDLDSIPRCSEREYRNPKCPFRPANKAVPIRWVKGYSLVDRCERWVPAVMSHLYFTPWTEERFWQQISTGVAAHVRPEAALISAICEVIERDTIALTWLAKLPLPRIDMPQPAPAALATNLAVLDASLIRQHFFDATTDVGVPSIYSIQLLEGHPVLSQYVNCATGFSAAEACAKTIREAAPARAVFQYVDDVPADVEDFQSLYDGASLLGQPAKRSAFDFLLNSPNQRPLADVEIDAPVDEAGRLNFLVQRLGRMGMDIVVVDHTTDELREIGVWVIRVVIPGLMPMSSVQAGRFLGHPRLYSYPESAGFGRLTEDDINPTPQPYA